MTRLKNKNKKEKEDVQPWEEVLKEFAKGLKTKFYAITRRICTIEKRITHLYDLMRFVDETKFSRRIKDIDQTINRITLRLHAEIVRNCVLTEVSHEYPHLTAKVLQMMDMDFEFFWKYRELSLAEWAKIAESDLHPEVAIEKLLFIPAARKNKGDPFLSK